jgi:hypothetical protein
MPSVVVNEHSYDAVRPLRVYLVRCAFRDQEEATDEAPREFMIDIALFRTAVLELGLHMTVSTAPDAPFFFSVTYGVDYRMSEHVEDAEREDVWRYTAYELGPSLLYPYIREFFSDVTGRSQFPATFLPYVPIPLDVPIEAQEIPSPPPHSGFRTGFDL